MTESQAMEASSFVAPPSGGWSGPGHPLTAEDFIERGDMKILRGYEALVAELGLDRFEVAMAYPGGEIVQTRPGSSVVRLTAGSQQLYLKRYTFYPVREFWRCCLKFHSRINRGCEWENILLVQALGVRTVTPIAAGRRHQAGRIDTFLLTLAMDVPSVDAFVREHLSGALTPPQVRLKRALIRELAQFMRHLHDHGLHYQDSHLWHFFVQVREGNEIQISLIDLMTLRQTRRLKYTIKDLARLYFDSVWEVPVSRTDRLRFYKAYTGRDEITRWDRWLFWLIIGKAWWMARRTRRVWRRRGQEFLPRPRREQTTR